MPIIELQRSIAEAGRIRIGQQVPTQSGGRRPAKLETFRLTSGDRHRIEQAAALYGGAVAEWASPNGKQWEVVTERDVLDVVVPPSDLSFSQNYELWSAGGCQRRCDGVTEAHSGESQPCLCDPAARECDIHTRLSVLLRDLPGLGVWRLDTQGWYAATELNGALEVIRMAAGVGRLLPARLRLDQRSVKRPDAKGKPVTLRFAVPVLDVEVTPALLLAGGQGEPLALATAPKTITPVPPAEDGEGRSIAEQSEPPPAKPRRANSAPPIPPSGRRRGAAAGADQPGGSGPAGQEEPEAGAGHATGGATAAVETVKAAPAAGSSTRRSAPACEHPADSREEIEAGTICRLCGTLLVRAADEAPASAEEPAAPARAREGAKEPGDPGYWQARLHAVAAERSIDHDGLRLVAAAVKRIPADEIAAFSLNDLEDATAEGLDKLLRQFPAPLEVDAATEWVAKVAEARGLLDWTAIDPLATAALSTSLDDAGVADWIAFGLRLHAGEYDPPAEEPEPEPAPKARSRRAAPKEETPE